MHQTHALLCLLSFPYSPTPTIKWFKKGGDLPGGKVKFENFNKTLKIINVSEEDAGEYVCMANNHLGSIRHSIFVQVKGEEATVAVRLYKYMSLYLCVSPSC